MTLPVDKFMRINLRERKKPFGDDECPIKPFTMTEAAELGTPVRPYPGHPRYGHHIRGRRKRRTA